MKVVRAEQDESQKEDNRLVFCVCTCECPFVVVLCLEAKIELYFRKEHWGPISENVFLKCFKISEENNLLTINRRRLEKPGATLQNIPCRDPQIFLTLERIL